MLEIFWPKSKPHRPVGITRKIIFSQFSPVFRFSKISALTEHLLNHFFVASYIQKLFGVIRSNPC
jgi:hypothetical protein